MDALQSTLTQIRMKAAELRESFGDDARARALEWAALQMESALHDRADERLTLAEASLRCGYSQDHLARLVREGKIPNAGRRGAPRVRAGDLPLRPPRMVAATGSRVYDPVADARAIGSRR